MKSWTWYAALTLIVFGAYWWTSAGRPGHLLRLRPVTPGIGQAAEQLLNEPLDGPHAKALLEQRPVVATLLSCWTALAIALALAGAWLSLRAASQGGLARVWQYPSRLTVDWTWTDAGRVMWLILLIAGLLPLAHLRLSEAGWIPLPHERMWTVITMGVLDLMVIHISL